MLASRVLTPMFENLDLELDTTTGSGLTPNKRHLRRKLSALFVHQQAPGQQISCTPEPFTVAEIPTIEADSEPTQEAIYLIEAVMCRLMSQPHKPLDSRYNSMLLSIFESYRTLNSDYELLKQKLEQEVGSHFADNLSLKHAELR